jgi:uncharacterized protein YbaP (TraB family)
MRIRHARVLQSFSAAVLLTAGVLAYIPPADAALFFERENHPALWLVEDGQSKIYIFGSHHVLKSGTRWMTERLLDAVEEADAFVFEVEPSEKWMPDAQDFIDGSGYLPEGARLRDLLSEEALASYHRVMRDLDLDPLEMDKQQPWLAQLTLNSAFYGERAYSVEDGSDVRILRYANSHDKPVRFLETPRQQLEYFAAAMESAPVNGLEKVVHTLRDDPNAITDNIRNWRAGNVEEMATRLHDFFSYSPSTRRILLDDRNRSWATQIGAMMTEQQTYFVTVGVGHLGGPGSVIEILCKEGWNVTRVPTRGEDVPQACALPGN